MSYLRQALLEAVLAAHGKVLDGGGGKQRVVVEQSVGAVDDGARGKGVFLARRVGRRSVTNVLVRFFIAKMFR